MITAEFIIGHSEDDATERKKEARKILWALLAALAIHLLIGYGLAVFGWLLSTPFSVSEEEKPVELTFVDLPATPQKNTIFVPNDQSKQTEKPKDQTFESNANSIAASEQPATGNMPLPSQDGSERTNLDLTSNAPSLATQGAQPQPSVAQEQATPQPTVQPTPETKSQEFAMLTSTPRPTVQPTAASTPQPPRSSYQRLKEKTKLSGAITNRGMSSVNAVGTPLGRYVKTIQDAIGSRWYTYTPAKLDLISLGTAQVVFTVDRSGKVTNLKIISNSSNEVFANVCLQSILEIDRQFPIPEEVAATLPPEGLEQQLTFTMFPN